jgi:transposase
VDCLQHFWRSQKDRFPHVETLLLNLDNGPENHSRRTQFMQRLTDFVDEFLMTIDLAYYPPYHSKYNPIERCWGILELKWNGTKLTDAETMLEWAKQMTWKGLHPVVELSREVYEKGISLGKAAMQAVEARLKRDPKLPKYDILINPASTA